MGALVWIARSPDSGPLRSPDELGRLGLGPHRIPRSRGHRLHLQRVDMGCHDVAESVVDEALRRHPGQTFKNWRDNQHPKMPSATLGAEVIGVGCGVIDQLHVNRVQFLS